MIRPARASDRAAIAAFTHDTFAWGDYVADEFEGWLRQPGSHMVVAVDEHDTAIAMSRGRLVSPTEAWFHAARVHPSWRGRGIAGDMANVLRRWAGEEGAIVGRLLIEDGNTASIRHVEKIGFRHVAGVVRCIKPIVDASPSPDGNGGRSVPSRLRPRRAHPADAAPALASWSVGELGRATRALAGGRWTYAKLTVEHLVAAAKSGAFWEIGAGWAVGDRDGETFDVGWLETQPEDATDLLRALIDVAVRSGAESIAVWLPKVDWILRDARRLGFDMAPMGVYAIAL